MKSKIYFFLSFLLFSCGSYKEVPYIQNSAEFRYNDSIPPYDMTIKPKDELRITVYSSKGGAATSLFNITELAPLDTKTLRVTSYSSSSHFYLVDNEGNIDYPLVGKLNIQGMTIEQAASFIKEKIRSYFTSDADYGVKVYITNYYVSVMGEVNRPNSYDVGSTKVNVLEALAMAGDLTIYGTRTNVKLLRQRPDGEYDIHQLDLTDANLLNSPYYYMQQRDILYVEPNPAKAQDSQIGETTRLWVRGASITVALGSLLYMVLK